jgi:hypothetical protein
VCWLDGRYNERTLSGQQTQYLTPC